MTRDDIIRMAEQSVLYQNGKFFVCDADELVRFAALVAAHEREACADICDQHASVEGIAQRCAAAIRARAVAERDAEIELLKAEVEALRKANDTFARTSILPDHLCIMERAEVEALKADAERYRWLRDTPWPADLTVIVKNHANATWDAAIDSARSKE